MAEQVTRYAMPIIQGGRLAAPVEAEQGYWMLFADHDRDIKALKARYHKLDMDAETFKTRVDALESLRREDTKVQERMRERLDKYEDTDYRQKRTITRLQGDCNHIADLEAGTERLNNALTVLIDINSDRMTQDEWDRYNAVLTEGEK